MRLEVTFSLPFCTKQFAIYDPSFGLCTWYLELVSFDAQLQLSSKLLYIAITFILIAHVPQYEGLD